MKFLVRLSILLIGLGFIGFRIKMIKVTPIQQAMTDLPSNIEKVAKSSSITTDTFLHVQQLRKRNLRNFCHQFPGLNNMNASEKADELLSTLAVSPKLLMVYCKPSDLAVDDWEEMIPHMEERVDVTIRSPLVDNDKPQIFPNKLADYDPPTLKHVLRTFTKVLFVRDPFERLVSRYMDGHAGEVTFEEFIDDLLLEEVGEDGLSFDSTVSLCHPCFVKYDYIVLYKYSKTELNHIVQRLGLPGKLHLSRSPRSKSKMTSRWLAENLFHGLSGQQINQLSVAYWCDLVAFGLHNSLLWNGTFVNIS
ncbi:carbohydrate sulfotransferase 14-like [Pyxicephalus adspersus]|uniref:carbohydrate sulfotransferase 14-like n=1 Tax=Pyxicephalus adspersus TaxID=30357 RepID=UPI003B5BE5F9